MNELVLKTDQEVAIASEMGAWGVKEVSKEDLIIPQILAMQGLSKLVAAEKAVMGEFRCSLTNKLIGKAGTAPFEIIPFFCQEVFSIQSLQPDGRYKYHSTEPIVKSPMNPKYNDNAPWEDNQLIDGKMTPIKRIRRYNFFVLLVSELEAGEGVMPYFISFKSTSVKEGKKIFNMMYVRNASRGLPPPAFQFTISGDKQSNDKGTFIVPQAEQSVQTKPQHLAIAFQWYKQLSGKGADVKLHDEEETADAEAPATGQF